MNRYARQIAVAGMGETGQRALLGRTVLVVGAGGLGASVLPLLVGAGVGGIDIVDPDTVALTDLHRQTLYRMPDIGRPKALAAAETLSALNPDCRIRAHVARLDPLIARRMVPKADLVIDAADMFAATYALSDLCLSLGKPLVSASVTGRAGYVGGFCGGAPSYRAVFPDLPANLQNCETAGVLGPAVATLGALQAQMCLDALLGRVPSPLGQMISLDLGNWRFSGFRFDDAPEPVRAAPEILSREQIEPEDVVIDLRKGPETRPEPPGDRRVVFVCATGLRAWRAARARLAEGHARVAIIGDGE